MIFDSHAHLDSENFSGEVDSIIERAKSNKIGFIMNPAVDYKSSIAAVELSKKYDMVYAAVGIHPHEASTADDMMLKLIKAMTTNKKVKAIGEIGLDYHYDFSPRDIQREIFIKQIRLAKEIKLPIIIHDREANKDVFDILQEENPYETGVVMHCYSGSRELAKEYLKLGAYISIAGPVTFKNNRKTVGVVESVPIERLFIETDSPYLTPVPYRGKRNEPSYVKYVAEEIAKIKDIPVEEVIKATTDNAKRFFCIK